MYDLKQDILKPVVKRIIERKDSLIELRRFAKNLGFEGWLKVEAIAALNKKVMDVKNKGVDLLLDDGLEIELKAANDLNRSYIRKGATKYQTPCLFIGGLDIGDGSKGKKVEMLESEKVRIIAYEIFNDGKNKWVVGIVAPKNYKITKRLDARMANLKKPQLEPKVIKRQGKKLTP